MKMMKKMGWEEGCPLGRSGQGLVEPIEVEIKMNRRGEYLPGHALVLFSVCTDKQLQLIKGQEYLPASSVLSYFFTT